MIKYTTWKTEMVVYYLTSEVYPISERIWQVSKYKEKTYLMECISSMWWWQRQELHLLATRNLHEHIQITSGHFCNLVVVNKCSLTTISVYQVLRAEVSIVLRAAMIMVIIIVAEITDAVGVMSVAIIRKSNCKDR